MPHRSPPSSSVEVAAGLVFREGRLLICRRPPGTHLAGFWEFPGGKREVDEGWQACLRRELREELAVEADVGDLYQEIAVAYPEKTVRIRFYLARLKGGEPQTIGCTALKWVGPEALRTHPFPPADTALLERLGTDTDVWAAG